ncbi:hypothetical protein [Pseudomonas sp. MWU12-2345]|uniref:hypothetical protein n=1 Tax=Pseudomonas sp. MWU12-2345 TaxID=2928689 RepID=UPI00200FA485|nr:hypothetical protein [Pseudomonas sp. MWU12-2345]
MSKLTYTLGFALGTVTREFLRAVKTTSASPVPQAKAALSVQLPPPCVPDNVLRDMDRQPAMLRAYDGIDLNLWYEENTRVVQKPTRKRRPRKTDADQVNTALVGSLTPAAC